MNAEAYGLIEVVFSFGAILAFLFWQLYSVRRSIREEERKAKNKSHE